MKFGRYQLSKQKADRSRWQIIATCFSLGNYPNTSVFSVFWEARSKKGSMIHTAANGINLNFRRRELRFKFLQVGFISCM